MEIIIKLFLFSLLIYSVLGLCLGVYFLFFKANKIDELLNNSKKGMICQSRTWAALRTDLRRQRSWVHTSIRPNFPVDTSDSEGFACAEAPVVRGLKRETNMLVDTINLWNDGFQSTDCHLAGEKQHSVRGHIWHVCVPRPKEKLPRKFLCCDMVHSQKLRDCSARARAIILQNQTDISKERSRHIITYKFDLFNIIL